MTEGFQQILDAGPDVPDAFLPGAAPADRTSQWNQFRAKTVALIAGLLWPQWDEVKQQWIGAAAETMFDLTAIDLQLIAKFKGSVLRGEKPSSPVGDPARPTHEAFFRNEDDSGLFNQYHFYDFTIGADLIEQFRKAFDARAADKFGTVHLQLKRVFQRPRPYQTVFLLGQPSFKPLRSISATTPSLCSGHSLQGVLGIGAVIEFVLLNGIPLSTGSFCALRQHAVDIGDRRVFAGLHYPSDNLASWIVAMTLANQVFPDPKVKVHLWKAISRQSRVFEEITYHPEYQDGLGALRNAAADVEAEVAQMPKC
jgi:hypothetical protein